jgi:hypothetical protein
MIGQIATSDPCTGCYYEAEHRMQAAPGIKVAAHRPSQVPMPGATE